MKLTVYSKNEILKGMSEWAVPKEYADPMFNYLVYGYSPGSFFTALLANNFANAIQHSHPGNTIAALKSLTGWINDYMPKEAYGSYEAVKQWCKICEDERRAVLEANHLIYTEKEETWMALKGVSTVEPALF